MQKKQQCHVNVTVRQISVVCQSSAFGFCVLSVSPTETRAKQAQACNTAPCLRISDIFT